MCKHFTLKTVCEMDEFRCNVEQAGIILSPPDDLYEPSWHGCARREGGRAYIGFVIYFGSGGTVEGRLKMALGLEASRAVLFLLMSQDHQEAN